MKTNLNKTQQRGVASLAIAIMLLISITLVTLYTSNVVLVETKMTADNFRTSEAVSNANAAMAHAVAYFIAGGIDQVNNATGAEESDCLVDYTVDSPLLDPGGSGLWQYYYNNDNGNACDCDQTSNKACALVVATGTSDDGTATRTMTQCLTMEPYFSNDGQGPSQPFFSKASVGVAGNARIINRYSNSSIWTGGAADVSGASFGTYLRDSDETQSSLREKCYNADGSQNSACNETYDDSAGNEKSRFNPNFYLDSNDETVEAQEVSNRDSGLGIDVITDDPTLGTKTADEVFAMFFGNKSKNEVMGLAEDAGQKYPQSGDSVLDKSDLIWHEGNLRFGGNDVVGTPTKPAILIVNGDFDITGGTVYGAVYIIGELKVAGNPVVKGSLVSESGDSSGAGTVDLVYVPFGNNGCGDKSLNDIIGAMGVVAGSWKDWQ